MRTLDMDGMDHSSYHCYLEQDGEILAYLRAFFSDKENGVIKIGRVLSVTHGIGHGARLIQEAVAFLQKDLGCQKIWLDAQLHAVPFYEKYGFEQVSEVFEEEGLLHVKMEQLM